MACGKKKEAMIVKSLFQVFFFRRARKLPHISLAFCSSEDIGVEAGL